MVWTSLTLPASKTLTNWLVRLSTRNPRTLGTRVPSEACYLIVLLHLEAALEIEQNKGRAPTATGSGFLASPFSLPRRESHGALLDFSTPLAGRLRVAVLSSQDQA